MYKLLSITNDEFTLSKLGDGKEELSNLIDDIGIDGFEILKVQDFDEKMIDKKKYIGRHLFFYPMWYSFVMGNEAEIINDFNSMENAKEYYRAEDKEGFISNLREELIDASKDEVKYVVLHISHMSLEEAYTYKYKVNSLEIVKAYVDVINKATSGLKLNFQLLLENNWYPGLNFKEKDVIDYIVKNINYEKVGFVLDTGHLINTNLCIENEEEAIDYLYSCIEEISDYKNYIKAIHLNMTFSGKYVSDIIKNNSYNKDDPYEMKMLNAMEHISKIDKHNPFTHNRIKGFIEYINPEFLVLELSFKNKEELIKKVEIQNQFLK